METPELIHHAFVHLSEHPSVYIDPYEAPGSLLYADYIFITHSHYDHLSLPDINKLMKNSTKIIAPEEAKSKLSGYKNILFVKPLQNYTIDNITFYTVPAYNINKQFHPKSNNWVGYVVTIDRTKYFHTGDTDLIPEFNNLSNMNIDYAFFPVGGTYTMNAEEAAKAADIIKAKFSIPMHYGKVVGSKNDALKFSKMVKNSKVII